MVSLRRMVPHGPFPARHVAVAPLPVNNRPETGKRRRPSFRTAAGWCFAPRPHAEERRSATRAQALPQPKRAAMRLEAKGKTESLVLILRDARTRVRIRGAFSTYALLRTRTSIACCKAHHTNSPSRCRGTRWLVRSLYFPVFFADSESSIPGLTISNNTHSILPAAHFC